MLQFPQVSEVVEVVRHNSWTSFFAEECGPDVSVVVISMIFTKRVSAMMCQPRGTGAFSLMKAQNTKSGDISWWHGVGRGHSHSQMITPR
jgi:hypothetical protein